MTTAVPVTAHDLNPAPPGPGPMADLPVQTGNPTPATPSQAMLTTLGLIAMISGLLVAAAYEFTAPIIAEKERLATEAAVLRILPGAVTKRDFVIGADGGLTPADTDPGSGGLVFAGYDAAGQLQGLAITGIANGYAGPVEVMFAYDPRRQAIVRSKVLKSTETPGFGDKLDTDAAFLKNLEALDARLNAEGSALANPIVTVKNGTKTQPWQIDAITGATISSRAMGKAANQAAQRAAPAIQRDLALLSQPRSPGGPQDD
ncbi:MAG TPA: FMN-binding protein [Chromatiaceae bacterium]|nr:FMN-binding protein [Chromatiaceae bacterium]